MFALGLFLRRVLIACALTLVATEAGAQQIPAPTEPSLNFVPGQYLVRKREGVTRQQCVEDLRTRAGAKVELIQEISKQGLLHIRIDDPPRSKDVEGAAALASAQFERGNVLAASDNVDRVEPVVQYRLAQAPTDSQKAAEAIRTVLDRMQVAKVWDVQQNTDKPIIVAVIDTGVHLEHEIFKGLLLPGYDVTRDVADGSAQRLPTGAMEDHGTRVAGMVATMLRAGPEGGPAPVQNIRILPIRATRLSPNGAQVVLTPDGIAAIDHAVTQGARVINLSWGEAVPSEELRAAIRRANDSGAVVIAAAGNGRNVGVTRAGYDIDAEPFYPASYKLPNIVGVAALNEDDVLAPWSNWGKTAVEIAAPGDGVMTAVPLFDAQNSRMGSGYSASSGTSFAAPLVAGGAALLMAAHPDFKPHEIVTLMTRGVDPLAPLATRVVSGGRINMDQVLLTAAPAYAVTPPAERPAAVVAAGSEIRTDNEKVPLDIRAYAETAIAGRPSVTESVLRGGDVTGAEQPSITANRIQILLRVSWWRRPKDVLRKLKDARAVEIKRVGHFYRNRYAVTIETQRDEADILASLKDLSGVRNVELVHAYPLQR